MLIVCFAFNLTCGDNIVVRVDFSDGNELSSLPKEIGSLSNLQNLRVGKCAKQLEEKPE